MGGRGRNSIRVAAAGAVWGAIAALAAAPAAADGPFGLVLEGSFAEGGFDRDDYRPPVTHFILNESPFITTELRPLYVHHRIPGEFATQGGDIDAVAVEGRLAITERLAFIATTDGWADIDFNAALPDTDGFLDVTAGFKYAVISDPARGEIVSLGLRYTAPVGDIKTGGIELTGRGAGYLNPFVTGAKVWQRFQIQGSAGMQIALSDENWSYVHLGAHTDYEVINGVFPFFEANAILPFDGGNQFAKNTPVFAKLTGADILDIGAPEPDEIVTVGAGARFRLTQNVLLGAGVETNVMPDQNTAFDFRFTTDLVVHF